MVICTEINKDSVGFEVLTAVVMKCTIFWDITPCSPSKVNRRFGGTCRFHFQSQRIRKARNQHEAGSKQEYYKRPVIVRDRKGTGKF
jgi:hypothetical protein